MGRFFLPVEPIVAKISAIRWSLQLAKKLNLEKILVKFDALVAADCIDLIVSNVNPDIVISDGRQFFENFRTSSIMFLSRTCNLDVHNPVDIVKPYGSKT